MIKWVGLLLQTMIETLLLLYSLQERHPGQTCEKMGLLRRRITKGSRWARTFCQILRKGIFGGEFQVSASNIHKQFNLSHHITDNLRQVRIQFFT